MKTRYQDSNFIIKIWRCRWYLALPFLWGYYTVVGGLPIIDDTDYSVDRVNGVILWKLLVGTIQSKMGWWYTTDEVFDEITKK